MKDPIKGSKVGIKRERVNPHPIPYQGSKRGLTHRILSFFPREKIRLFEPFAGSAAVSLAAAAEGRVGRVFLNDSNEPLMNLWERIIKDPYDVISTYTLLWKAQLGHEKEFFDYVRKEFNKNRHPDYLLYLLLRCVKASVRYNSNGEFNQSPDNRRKGTMPGTLARHLLGTSRLLQGITTVRRGDFQDALADANPGDLIYMDPPYQGVCGRKDNRYCRGVPFAEFVDALRKGTNDLFLLSSVMMGGRETRHTELCFQRAWG